MKKKLLPYKNADEMRKNFETEKAEKEKLEEELKQVKSKLAELELDQKKTKEDIENMRKEFDRKIELKCVEGYVNNYVKRNNSVKEYKRNVMKTVNEHKRNVRHCNELWT